AWVFPTALLPLDTRLRILVHLSRAFCRSTVCSSCRRVKRVLSRLLLFWNARLKTI
ncbi:hypothetical protein IW137_003905, partial [Coemansia sp. RSA 1287]